MSQLQSALATANEDSDDEDDVDANDGKKVADDLGADGDNATTAFILGYILHGGEDGSQSLSGCIVAAGLLGDMADRLFGCRRRRLIGAGVVDLRGGSLDWANYVRNSSHQST